jgi:hypothetical protein
MELRIYFARPLPIIEIPDATAITLQKLQEIGLSPKVEDLALFCNRAGLHYYTHANVTQPLLDQLHQYGWRKSKT